MEFKKRKPGIIIYYITSCLCMQVAVVLILTLVSLGKFHLMSLIYALCAPIIFLVFGYFLVAEVKQTIKLRRGLMIFESFIVKGEIADGEVRYNEVERIEFKRTLLKPFSRSAFFVLRDNTTLILNDDFINYRQLWKTACDNCKGANPNVIIDEKLVKYLRKYDG